jgi:hypothetical protein
LVYLWERVPEIEKFYWSDCVKAEIIVAEQDLLNTSETVSGNWDSETALREEETGTGFSERAVFLQSNHPGK